MCVAPTAPVNSKDHKCLSMGIDERTKTIPIRIALILAILVLECFQMSVVTLAM